MSDKKNIERLFQEKFKDFEAIPAQKVWDNIEAELHKKKKRKVIPIWFRLSRIAAVLLVGVLIGYGILNTTTENTPFDRGVVLQEENKVPNDTAESLDPIESNSIVTATEYSNPETNPISSEPHKFPKNATDEATVNQENPELSVPIKQASALQGGSSEKANVLNRKNNNNTLIVNAPKNKENATGLGQAFKNESIANSGTAANKNEIKNPVLLADSKNKNAALAVQENTKSKIFENALPQSTVGSKNKTSVPSEINTTTPIAFDTNALEKQKKDSAAVATVVPNALEELLKQQEKEKELVTETKVNRWQITSNVAPIYFSSASNGSPISSEFSDNSKSYERNISYGVGVNYALSNKWTVRGGVNKLTLGYNTNNIVYYPGLPDASSSRSSNSHFQSKGSQMIIEDNSASNMLSFSDIPGKNVGHLNQTMGYIEVPMELSYKLLNRKFGIELIGGMSTMFLNENNLSVISGEFVTSAGQADNLNDISFTTNIGLGFKYNFWKSFQANIEPKFKYQLNTFSENDGGFKPYFIGIYSGVSFSF